MTIMLMNKSNIKRKGNLNINQSEVLGKPLTEKMEARGPGRTLASGHCLATGLALFYRPSNIL